MAILTWETLSGKAKLILIFLVILAILILIVSKIAPEMSMLSEKIEGLGL